MAFVDSMTAAELIVTLPEIENCHLKSAQEITHLLQQGDPTTDWIWSSLGHHALCRPARPPTLLNKFMPDQ